MVYNVTCYKNTGFSTGNIPSSPSVVNLAETVSLTANQIWKLQDDFLSQVRLNMSWSDAKQVDYIKIDNAYYTVEGLEMTNNVAVFTIAYDPINSVGGIGSISIIDGWVKRASPKTDTLFGNIIQEPFTPKKELVIDGVYGHLSGTSSTKTVVVGATVDLLDTTSNAIEYSDPTTGSSVTVPSLTPVPQNTAVSVGITTASGWPDNWSAMTQILPNMRLYDFSNSAVKEGIMKIRSINAEDSITSCYSLPSTFIAAQTSLAEGDIDTIAGAFYKMLAGPNYEYGSYTPKNKKVFALYNTYHFLSMASGDTKALEAREIYDSSASSPYIYIYADPAPNGRPYCQPAKYEGRDTLPFEQSIQGAEWLSTPITFYGAGGQSFRDVELAQSAGERRETAILDGMNVIAQAIGAAADVANVGSLLNVIGGPAQLASAGMQATQSVISTGAAAASATMNYRRDKEYSEYKYNSANVVAPDIKFPRGAEKSGYVGNDFLTYRVGLSDEDLKNFDEFLTKYGYADSRPLEQADLSSHTHFNYIQADNVAVKGTTFNIYEANMISKYFSGGVRLWHELPNLAAMKDNPIK